MHNSTNSETGVQYLTVTMDQAGQRIDNFLLAQTRGVPKSHVYRIIRTGQVRVNGGRVKPARKLAAGDKVRLPPLVQRQRDVVTVPDALVARLERAIVYEDDDVLVLNKPAGIAVHAGGGLPFGVIEALRQSRSASGMKPELAHRLDRGTSGCLLLGKSQRSGRALQQLFRERSVKKYYRALVSGRWPCGTLRIEKPLTRYLDRSGERSVRVDADGRDAVSLFTFDHALGDTGVSAVSVEILTGRMHQIRVHAAAAGHAVVGDKKYAGMLDNRDLKRRGFYRMFLHCRRLVLSGAIELDVEAGVEPEWKALMERYSSR